MGMRNRISGIGKEWTAPLKGKINTSIFNMGSVNIDDCVKMTLKHIKKATND